MSSARLGVAAISLDFGNTLVRVDRAGLRRVVEDTADTMLRTGIASDRAAFLEAWVEERDRQFREEVPQLRETDLDQRAVRVLARLRGMATPLREDRWDDERAAEHSAPAEIDAMVDAYSAAFLDRMRPAPDALATLQALSARGFPVAILSNWPMAVTIDRFATAHGWDPFLRAVVVSQRVGVIKPHPAIFRAAESAFGLAEGAPILHVGDDWAADVVGARAAGWRAGYLRGHQDDTPLPTSSPPDAAGARDDGPVIPDLEIDELAELDALVDLVTGDTVPVAARPDASAAATA